MKKKIRKKNRIVSIIMILFFVHGIYYQAFPSTVWDVTNPIKIMKYVLFGIGVVLFVNVRIFILLSFLSIILLIQNLQATSVFDSIQIVNYLLPMYTLALYTKISERVSITNIIKTTYVVMTVVAYLEFFTLRQFIMYADKGYRCVSIFLNPNNMGNMIWILSAYLIIKEESVKTQQKMIIFINSIFLLIMSGSRSNMLIFALIFIIHFGAKIIDVIKFNFLVKRESAFTILSCTFLLVALVFIPFSNIVKMLEKLSNMTRKFSDIKIDGRGMQRVAFFNSVKENLIFPNSVGIYKYTDNLYLHIWGFFGFAIMCVYILFLCILLYRAYKRHLKYELVMIMAFFIYGFAENFIYCWPVGFVFWYIVGNILFGNTHINEQLKRMEGEEGCLT